MSPLSRECCLNRQKESPACVEVANDVLQTDSASVSSVDSSRGQQLKSHEELGSDKGCHGGIGVNDAFLCEKFEQVFGTPLLNSDSDDSVEENTEGCSLWWGAISLKGKQYELPHGGVGT